MKLKKLISAVAAVAMSVTMISAFTVADAASLGGSPSMSITFDTYESLNATYACAYLNITVDMSAAEALSAYSNDLDEETWEEVITGNGITTMGITWTVPSGFTYLAAKSTIPSGFTANATSITYGPKTNPAEYWTTAVTTFRLAYRCTIAADSSGAVTIPANAFTVNGKNSAENTVWAYASTNGTATASTCSIPSYTEWSTPVVTDPWVAATSAGFFTADEFVDDQTNAVAYYVSLDTPDAAEESMVWKANFSGTTKYHSVNIGSVTGPAKYGVIIKGVETAEDVTEVKAAWGSKASAE